MGTDPNPRKTLRCHSNHLQREIAAIEKRLKRFKKERERLLGIEKNGTIEEARFAAENWHRLNWLSFDL